MKEFNRSLAILLGINAYQNGVPKLNTAKADAERLAEILKDKHGYDCLLRVNEEVSLDRLKRLLEDELPQMVGENDRVLFYFAGHGVATNGDDGPEGYILPQDAKLENDTTFLQMTELNRSLCALKCRHMLVILDCCFAGAFRWSSIRNLSPIPKIIHREQYDYYVSDPAWQAIASAAYDQTALDKRHETDQHSPFAKALFAGLLGEADVFPAGADGRRRGDGVITATELYLYLREKVEGAPGTFADRQTPTLWPIHRRHGKGEYIFLVPDREPLLPPAPPLNRENNPYRGLMPYDESHQDLFFGRRNAITELTTKVTTEPLSVVVGASGTGKSSLVKAGLLPRLRQHSEMQWQILSPIRPGKNPMQVLANLLSSPNEPTAPYCALPMPSLANVVQAWRNDNPEAKLLLVVDQLEELVTMCRDKEELRRFMDSLAECLRLHAGQFHLVVTLRSDFEPHFSGSALKDYWNTSRFVAALLTQNELREAIEGPAIARVLRFEPPELVDRIINDVLQMPGALPLLSFTLSEMYFKYLERHSDDRALTDADYDTSLGGIGGALRHRAQEEYESLDVNQKDTTRRVILRMVSLEGGEVARRRVPLSELSYGDAAEDERVVQITDRFTDARLVVRGVDGDGVAYIEPAHDALVLGWNNVWKWIHEEQQQQDNLLLQRRLTEAANDWNSGGRKSGQLWDDDPRLPQVQSIATARKYYFNALESEFIATSVKQQSRLRRKRLSIAAAVFLFLVGATIVAWYQAMQAANARDEAEKQKGEALTAFVKAENQKFIAQQESYEARVARAAAVAAEGVAKQERDRANTERGRAVAAQGRAESELARSLYDQSQMESGERGDRSKALVLAAMAAESAPRNDPRREIYKLRALHLSNHAPSSVAPLSTGLLQSAAVSPRRDMMLAFDYNGIVTVWDATKDESYPVPKELTARAASIKEASIRVAFSPDSESVALINTGVPLELWIWKTRSGEQKLHVQLPRQPGTDVLPRLHFSADSRFVLVDDWKPKQVQIWEVERAAAGPTAFGTNLSDSPPLSSNPSRNWMVTGSNDGGSYKTQVLDIATGRPVCRNGCVMEHSGEIVSAMFSPDAQWFVAVSENPAGKYEMQVWNAETGQAQLVEPWLSAQPLRITDVSRDGRRVLTVGKDGAAELWFADRRISLSYPVKDPEHLSFSEDEQFVITAELTEQPRKDPGLEDKSKTYKFGIWDFNKIRRVDTWTRFMKDIFIDVNYDRRAMNAVTNAGKVFNWSFLHVPQPSIVELKENQPDKIFFTPNGKSVLILSYETDRKPELRLWDVKTGDLIWRNGEQLPSGDLELIQVAMDSRHVVGLLKKSGVDESRIYLWDMARKDPAPYMDVNESVNGIAFRQRTGRVVLARSGVEGVSKEYSRLEECEIATSSCSSPAGAKYDPFNKVTFSLDGESYLLLTVSSLIIGHVQGAGEISIPFDSFMNFDSFTSNHLPNIVAFMGILFPAIREVQPTGTKEFSFFIGPRRDPKQRPIVAGISSGSFALRNTNTGLPFTFPTTFDDQKGIFAVSGDGKWIAASTGSSSSVRIWETATGSPASEEMQLPVSVNNFYLSSDGQQFLTVTEDAVIQKWYFGGREVSQANWLKGIGGALTGFKQTSAGFDYLRPRQYVAFRDSFLRKLRIAAKSDAGACFLLKQYEPSRCAVTE